MRSENRQGALGQKWAASELFRIGVLMVERIATPVILIPAHATRKDVFRVVFEEVVSGDHRGVLPGGRSVLAETKTMYDRNLRYSDLRPHQPERLTQHTEAGGLSLLVWVNEGGAHVMQWPVPGFAPGKSITRAQAESLRIHHISEVK